MSVVFVVCKGASTPVAAGKTIRIGRAPNCDLVLLDDLGVSRQHCEIFFDGENVLLRDLRSSNGTLLNGTVVEQLSLIEEGDSIQVGDTSIAVQFGNDPPLSTKSLLR